MHERFGADRAALVAAFPTFRARGAIRELGKVLGLPAGEIERRRATRPSHWIWVRRDTPRSTRLPGTGRTDWALGVARAPGRGRRSGLPRHLFQHSGGMVVATRPLIDCCPVVPAAMAGRQMVQWDKDSCADAGF